ncbi:MAG: GNAT family N-acetyltransferase [Clostridia bacterium]|nr:GNAT family N-acetyltransferase [Clostridia bacterium]
MDIRILNGEEFELSKALWAKCFGDGDDFIGYYYSLRTKPEYVLGAFDGESLVGMIHMRPILMRFDGQVKNICLVAGVCTDPGYRRRGVCSRLFEKAFQIMEERGFDAAVLQPFDPAFYVKFGYRTYITRQRITFIKGNTPLYERIGNPIRPYKANEIKTIYDGFMDKYDGAAIRDEEYFEGFIREYSAPDARLTVKDDGCSAGYADGDTLYLDELFYRNGADVLALLPDGFSRYVFPLPTDEKCPDGCLNEAVPFSMIRPIKPDFTLGEGKTYGFDRY